VCRPCGVPLQKKTILIIICVGCNLISDYYWGYIQQKFKKDTNATFYTYAIIFEDGDFLPETSAKDMHSLVEYNELVANGSINRGVRFV
jgi:hypothetical protein